ncbi:Fic family protein [Candidatus Woesearchaeota archaeon]|jgi:Fic family protein|nr:Fic family protein [Candidatus Woesearchaeota archaeon]MBT7402389.1 Fic family protein [Candidatus Woesearchaeota archaeon]
MVYHEIRNLAGKKHNYLIYNSRAGNKWVKKSKYLGEGYISGEEIKKAKVMFELEIQKQKKFKFLSVRDVAEIEILKQKVLDYFEKAGKSGVESFKEWFSTELTYNSNAIEGNTLSLKDTSLIINDNLTPTGASLREVHEARNHKDAIIFMENYSGDFNEQFINHLHKQITKNIDDENAGRYRKVQVFIRGSDVILPPPEIVPKLVKDVVEWYKQSKKKYHPFELAIITSMKFVSVHPFTDGNGRTSRLIMNFILKKNTYPKINIYVKDRSDYLSAVRHANDKDYLDIINFLIKTIKKNYTHMGTS